MENQSDDKKLIGKLIEKRKKENSAFMKLLNAIEARQEIPVDDTSKKKNKRKH